MSERVTPSRQNLKVFKEKIISAKKGHELLKRKCDSLKVKFQKVMASLLESKQNMGEEMAEALLLLAGAQYSAGDFTQNVLQSINKKPSIRVTQSQDNVAGVKLPVLEYRENETQDNLMNDICIDKGASQIMKAKEKFKECVKTLVMVASQQTSFVTLDEVIKITSRRVNALEHVVIPRFTKAMEYIIQELDEMARDEFVVQ